MRFIYFVSPVFQDMNDRISGYTRKYCSFDRSCVDFAIDLEHNVHCTNFFYIFSFTAIQPQYLRATIFFSFYLTDNRSCIVTATFCKSGTTLYGTNIFIFNHDLNRSQTFCIVSTYRRKDDYELICF